MSRRLTIQIVGSAEDKKNVRLTDFIEQLNNVKKALAETELAVSGKSSSTIEYRIVDLRHNSPATVVIEPIAYYPDGKRDRNRTTAVIESFAKELKTIKKKGETAIEPELNRLAAIRNIGVKQNSRVEEVKITVGRNVVTIDEDFRQKLDAIVGPDEFAHGSVSGMLDVVNLHDGNRFQLYPSIGARKVSGTFPGEIRPVVKNAIGCFVTVTGRLRYKAWSPYPHGINAESIDIHEPDNELPSLTDLRGVFAGITGDLASEEFVHQLRDEKA
jgi:hypothetical protein